MEHQPLSEPEGHKPAQTKQPKFLDWLPWETTTIWGLFLLAVYVLRHFFFIIFLTFIVSYIMRSIIGSFMSVLSPRKERLWLERILAVVCFALLLFGLFEGGRYFGPRLLDQAYSLVGRVSHLEPQRELDNILSRTVGAWKFRQMYGGDSKRYEEELARFKTDGFPGIKAYHEFQEIRSATAGAIEFAFREEETARLESELESKVASDEEFQQWFLTKKAAAIQEKAHEAHIKSWEDNVVRMLGAAVFAEFKQRLDYEKMRDEGIRATILEQTKQTAEDLKIALAEWKDEYIHQALEQAKQSEQYQQRLRPYYEAKRREEPKQVPYDFDKFMELQAAYEQGMVAFAKALVPLEETAQAERSEQQWREDFQFTEQQKLAKAWWSDEQMAKQVKETLLEYGKEAVTALGGGIQRWITTLVTLPVQVALSLLLSFFITVDIPNMRRGIRRLEHSRVSDFYAEIAPGLLSFGRLIGRSFQAQGVIAFFNTLLSFLAIRYLEIQNEVFLCAIVFVCSFIPVLGVVLSSVPIAIMSLIQPGGSIWLALQIMGVILVIHFLETSVLNPKILGDMLHLHPVLVLTVLAVSEHFFGVWGLLLGVPVAVYIIRFVILDEGIPGLIEPVRIAPPARVSAADVALHPEPDAVAEKPPRTHPVSAGAERVAATGDVRHSQSVP